jgi:hypothetical protein
MLRREEVSAHFQMDKNIKDRLDKVAEKVEDPSLFLRYV